MVFIRVDAATNDISFKEVLLPRADDTTRYSYRDTIKLAARFINTGTATQSNVVVTATVRWGMNRSANCTHHTALLTFVQTYWAMKFLQTIAHLLSGMTLSLSIGRMNFNRLR
jgi:hypothetical protein